MFTWSSATYLSNPVTYISIARVCFSLHYLGLQTIIRMKNSPQLQLFLPFLSFQPTALIMLLSLLTFSPFSVVPFQIKLLKILKAFYAIFIWKLLSITEDNTVNSKLQILVVSCWRKLYKNIYKRKKGNLSTRKFMKVTRSSIQSTLILFSVRRSQSHVTWCSARFVLCLRYQRRELKDTLSED